MQELLFLNGLSIDEDLPYSLAEFSTEQWLKLSPIQTLPWGGSQMALLSLGLWAFYCPHGSNPWLEYFSRKGLFHGFLPLSLAVPVPLPFAPGFTQDHSPPLLCTVTLGELSNQSLRTQALLSELCPQILGPELCRPHDPFATVRLCQ